MVDCFSKALCSSPLMTVTYWSKWTNLIPLYSNFPTIYEFLKYSHGMYRESRVYVSISCWLEIILLLGLFTSHTAFPLWYSFLLWLADWLWVRQPQGISGIVAFLLSERLCFQPKVQFLKNNFVCSPDWWPTFSRDLTYRAMNPIGYLQRPFITHNNLKIHVTWTVTSFYTVTCWSSFYIVTNSSAD